MLKIVLMVRTSRKWLVRQGIYMENEREQMVGQWQEWKNDFTP